MEPIYDGVAGAPPAQRLTMEDMCDILAALGDDGDYDDVSDAGSRSGTYALDGGVSAAIVPADEAHYDAMSPRSSTSSSRTDDVQLTRQGVDGNGVRARPGGPIEVTDDAAQRSKPSLMSWAKKSLVPRSLNDLKLRFDKEKVSLSPSNIASPRISGRLHFRRARQDEWKLKHCVVDDVALYVFPVSGEHQARRFALATLSWRTLAPTDPEITLVPPPLDATAFARGDTVSGVGSSPTMWLAFASVAERGDWMAALTITGSAATMQDGLTAADLALLVEEQLLYQQMVLEGQQGGQAPAAPANAPTERRDSGIFGSIRKRAKAKQPSSLLDMQQRGPSDQADARPLDAAPEQPSDASNGRVRDGMSAIRIFAETLPVQTKSKAIIVSESATARQVIALALQKFGAEVPVEDYALFERHPNGEEVAVDNDARPVALQNARPNIEFSIKEKVLLKLDKPVGILDGLRSLGTALPSPQMAPLSPSESDFEAAPLDGAAVADDADAVIGRRRLNTFRGSVFGAPVPLPAAFDAFAGDNMAPRGDIDAPPRSPREESAMAGAVAAAPVDVPTADEQTDGDGGQEHVDEVNQQQQQQTSEDDEACEMPPPLEPPGLKGRLRLSAFGA